ncbi:putative F-box/LRR-repeat protein At5g02700 [Triticum urartu]|uniref:putative F-box/LRR-repeat protein At5g02700 n=1 Tax=Triticum urartu TaxID=4572 RepID=UPI00204411B6|nr:putative F-box/LRR-repeat protein At5g02700 [Triticum urartu]XP_048550326.1 putative F-box/LRR-repeat protein At5g02700 [Triticum urartu]
MEKKKAAAARSARKERKSHGAARSGDCGVNAGDFISRLPDAVIGTIISLLPTKDGGRTQILSRRWRHLWRSAPLNLEVVTGPLGPCPGHHHPSAVHHSAVSKIISQHLGPARRFCLKHLIDGDLPEMESWLDSRAIVNLQELDITNYAGYKTGYTLPQSVFRSASTLLVAKIMGCNFPDAITCSMNFYLLNQLSLDCVSIPANVFHGLLSGCHALESLAMLEVHAAGCLRVSSTTLRSIGFRKGSRRKAELVLEDTPHLERLLLPYCDRNNSVTIRVIWAPKLQIFGPFSTGACELRVFQGMSLVSSTNSICTVKVLALGCSEHQLGAVLDVLMWFPCLEKLYVTFHAHYRTFKQNEQQCDPLHPVCLQTHLKRVVFKLFKGSEQQIEFVMFFILYAKVGNRASRYAQFTFRNISGCTDDHVTKHIHDLSLPDPFRLP